MKLKRLSIACFGSLLLIGFAGCKKVIHVELDNSLAPVIPTPPPGGTIEWTATSGDFDVIFDGRSPCREPNPLQARNGGPAVCTVAREKSERDKKPIVYTYHFQRYVHGRPIGPPTQPYNLYIGPHGCPMCGKAQ
jgi:hypothetical protein